MKCRNRGRGDGRAFDLIEGLLALLKYLKAEGAPNLSPLKRQ